MIAEEGLVSPFSLGPEFLPVLTPAGAPVAARTPLSMAGVDRYIRLVYTEVMVTKVFRSGNSQAVRIPRQFRLEAKEVEIFRRGEEIVIRQPSRNLARAFDLLTGLSPDFLKFGRQQAKPQKRKTL
jgi:antitoxin VapB